MVKDGKDDEKLEVTPEVEVFGYISLDQAQVSALQGRPGVEQFTINKTVPIQIRQVVAGG